MERSMKTTITTDNAGTIGKQSLAKKKAEEAKPKPKNDKDK